MATFGPALPAPGEPGYGTVGVPDVVPIDFGGGYSPPDITTVGDTGAGGSSLSGIGDIFDSILTGVTKIYQATNPPRPTLVGGTNVVYDPVSGRYVPAVAGQQAFQPNLLLLVLGVLLVVMLTKK